MTVRELIEKLWAFDPDEYVGVGIGDADAFGDVSSVTHVHTDEDGVPCDPDDPRGSPYLVIQ